MARGNVTPGMLRVGTFFADGIINSCALHNLSPRPGCRFPGASAEITRSVLYRIGVPYQLFPYEHWEDMFDDVAAGVLHTSAFVFLATPERRKLVDFSLPVEQNSPMFLVRPRQPSAMHNALLIFKTLPLSLWIIFLATFIVLIASILLLRKYRNQSTAVWPLLRYCIDQCNEAFNESSFIANALLIMLGLLIIMLLNLYQGALLTTLLHPVVIRPFRDVEEFMSLIESGEYTLIDSNNSYHAWMLANSDGFYYRRLRSALKKNPVQTVNTFEEIERMVKTGDFVYPSLHNHILKDEVEQGCSLTLIGHGPSLMTFAPEGFIFTQGSPLKELVNTALLGLQDHIENVLQMKYSHPRHQCKSRSVDFESLGLPLLYGLFALVGIGSLIGLVTCLVEVVWSNKCGQEVTQEEGQETSPKYEPITEEISQSRSNEMNLILFHIDELEKWLSNNRCLAHQMGIVTRLQTMLQQQ